MAGKRIFRLVSIFGRRDWKSKEAHLYCVPDHGKLEVELPSSQVENGTLQPMGCQIHVVSARAFRLSILFFLHLTAIILSTMLTHRGYSRWEPVEQHYQRDCAPHLKIYCSLRKNNREMDWWLLTSANLSKGAWGEGSKNLHILHYEAGVVFFPSLVAKVGCCDLPLRMWIFQRHHARCYYSL